MIIAMIESNALNRLKSEIMYHKGLKAANDKTRAINNAC